ncbi:MAG: DNA cytosine methyltransferase, partial [Blastocatellia bacterium]|nr:DNA cytosine methyltransferase [Blastocatellia bacterium]
VTVRDAIYDLRDEAGDLPFNAETLTARAMLQAGQGETDPRHYSTAKLNYAKPAPTLRKDFLGYFHYRHPEAFRPLNLSEWKRIGTFPDDFTFTDKKNGCQRIGNSVPPNFMRAIAEHIYSTILTPTRITS